MKQLLVSIILCLCFSCLQANTQGETLTTEAIKEIALRAEKGDEEALRLLAIRYENNQSFPEHYILASKWYALPENEDNMNALYELGIMYEHGIGVVSDKEKADKFYTLALHAGHPDGESALSWYYNDDKNQKPNRSLSPEKLHIRPSLGLIHYDNSRVIKINSTTVSAYTQSALRGNAEDQYYLGLIYAKKQNYKTAIKWYERAANQGHPGAQFNLAGLYALGLGVKQDFQIAFDLYQKIVKTADLVVYSAQFNLGVMYENAMGVTKSDETAVDFYQKASLVQAQAQYNLASMYFYGKGCVQNYQTALKLYTKAANQEVPEASYNIGVMYDKGLGVKQDRIMSFNYFKTAAKMGDEKAKFIVGILSDSDGDSQERSNSIFKKKKTESSECEDAITLFKTALIYDAAKDYHTAFNGYVKAAEQGYSKAQTYLGYMYYEGKGVEQSYYNAFKWFTKAAEQSDKDAQCNIGIMYLNGEGLDQDYPKAFEWLMKAAEQGSVKAQYNIGTMYLFGKGVTQNKSIAKEYMKKSCNFGNQQSCKAYRQLKEQIR